MHFSPKDKDLFAIQDQESSNESGPKIVIKQDNIIINNNDDGDNNDKYKQESQKVGGIAQKEKNGKRIGKPF